MERARVIQLRDYQLRAEEQLRLALRIYRMVLLVLPTGGGKGVLIAWIMRSAFLKGKRVLFAAHREEILAQVAKHLEALGVPFGWIASGMPAGDAQVMVGSIQTMARRVDRLPDFDIVLVDEAHHAAAPTWKAVIDRYVLAIVIGFTATPYRTDGTGLGSVGFQYLICVAQIHELIEQGYLVPPRVFCPPGPSLAKVKVTAGDYNMKAAAAILDRPVITGNIISHWKKLAEGRPTICFTTGLHHSKEVVAAFVAAGVLAEDVDAGSKDREGALRRFSSGETLVLVNCGLFTEGTDLPLCSCVIHARPTMSPSLCRQMTGRPLRLYGDKVDAIIIDAVGNTVRHGLPTDPETYTLLGRERRSKEPVPSVTVCHRCFAVYSSRLETCPGCGEAKRHKPRAAIKTVDGELVEAGKLALAQWGRHVSQDERIAFLAEKMRVAREREYKPKWPAVQYSLRFGFWPLPGEERRAWERAHEF